MAKRIEHKNNPKRVNRRAAAIAGSIAASAQNSPILVADNTVIAGHARLLAARNLGLREVSVVEIPRSQESHEN